MAEPLWLEVVKIGGLASIPLVAILFLVVFQNKVFLPSLLANHQSAMIRQAEIYATTAGDQSKMFGETLDRQRGDFLQALKDRDLAETERNKHQMEVFERRCEAQIDAAREMVKIQGSTYSDGMRAVSEELRVLKHAVTQSAELGVYAARDAEQSAEEMKRRGAREMLRGQERERERG